MAETEIQQMLFEGAVAKRFLEVAYTRDWVELTLQPIKTSCLDRIKRACKDDSLTDSEKLIKVQAIVMFHDYLEDLSAMAEVAASEADMVAGDQKEDQRPGRELMEP